MAGRLTPRHFLPSDSPVTRDPQQGRDTFSRYTAALAYSDFRTLWTASLFAGAAAWALIVARGWLVFELSDSSLWVGVVTFAAMIPRVLVSPFTGYLSDRFDRRMVLASMFALNLGHNLVLAILVLTGNVEIWHLVVLSLVNGSARAAQMPAGQALIPNLVPRNLLLNAIALNQATMHGSRLIGPAAIAPLLATTGPSGAFFLCTGFYAISLVQSLRIRTASTGRIDRSKNFAKNLAAGAVYVYQTPMLRAIVLIALFHCGLTMSFESLLPVLSTSQLNAEGAGFSYLMMAVGAGALVSAMTLAGIRSEVTKGRLFLYVGVLSGLAPVVLGLSTSMAWALIGAVLMGVSQAAFMTLTHTMIQSIVSDGVRGRVGGIYSVHIGGTMATINLFNGLLADYIDAQFVLIAGGLAFVAIMVLSWNYNSLRQIYTKGLAREAPATAAD
jgi:MFS family permease